MGTPLRRRHELLGVSKRSEVLTDTQPEVVPLFSKHLDAGCHTVWISKCTCFSKHFLKNGSKQKRYKLELRARLMVSVIVMSWNIIVRSNEGEKMRLKSTILNTGPFNVSFVPFLSRDTHGATVSQ